MTRPGERFRRLPGWTGKGWPESEGIVRTDPALAYGLDEPQRVGKKKEKDGHNKEGVLPCQGKPHHLVQNRQSRKLPGPPTM
jgi:hypothetical protein